MIDSPSRTHILIQLVVGDEWQGSEPYVLTRVSAEISSFESLPLGSDEPVRFESKHPFEITQKANN